MMLPPSWLPFLSLSFLYTSVFFFFFFSCFEYQDKSQKKKKKLPCNSSLIWVAWLSGKWMGGDGRRTNDWLNRLRSSGTWGWVMENWQRGAVEATASFSGNQWWSLKGSVYWWWFPFLFALSLWFWGGNILILRLFYNGKTLLEWRKQNKTICSDGLGLNLTYT